jgi:hypothetical protein
MKLLNFYFALIVSFLIFGPKNAFAELIEVPKNCRQQNKFPCHLRAIEMPYQVKFQDHFVHLSEGSNIRFLENEIELLRGQFWISSQSPVKVLTSFAKIDVDGDAWLVLEPEKMVIKNMNAKLAFKMVNNSPFSVPIGFENWVSGIDQNGKLVQGLLRPLDLKATSTLWVKTFRVPKEEAKKSIEEFVELWRGNVEKGADFYRAVASEKLKKEQEKELIKEQRRKQAAEENAELKKLFRSRNGLTDQGL